MPSENNDLDPAIGAFMGLVFGAIIWIIIVVVVYCFFGDELGSILNFFKCLFGFRQSC